MSRVGDASFKVVNTHRGPIYIKKEPSEEARGNSRPLAFHDSSQDNSAASRVNRTHHPSNFPMQQAKGVEKYVNDDKPAKTTLYELSGSLQITGGLAYTGTDTHLSVSRVFHGRVMDDQGYVFFKDGAYKILASDLKGHIVVKLYDNNRRVLGRGEFDLYQLPIQARKLSQIDKLNIEVKPYRPSAVASLSSGRSAGHYKEMVSQGQVMVPSINRYIQDTGEHGFADHSFLPYSSFIMKAQKQGFWNSLWVGLSGQDNPMRIYPHSMVEDLAHILNIKVNGQTSMVWGRVTWGGKPLKGAQVELAGDGEIRPIYFNAAYLPDPQLAVTGADGLFVFIGSFKGIQALRATKGGEYISTQVIPVRENHVSYVEVEAGIRRSASVAVYDGSTGEALSAGIEVYGSEKVIEVSGLGEEAIHFPGGNGVMMLEVDSGEEYPISRYSVHRRQKFIDLPVVKAKWMDQVRAHQKVGSSPHRGIVVGYVKGSDFDVFMDQEIEYESRNIVYFDKKGQIIPSDSGKNGGGFILFNVPEGLRTVTVIPTGSTKVFTQMLVVGEDAVNVMPVNLL